MATSTTPRAVFDTEAHARAFSEGFERIFRAEAKGVSRPKLVAAERLTVDVFWRQRNKKRKLTVPVQRAPQGTLFAKAVKLLEEV